MKGTPDRRHQLIPLAGVQFIGLLCGVVGVRWTSAVIPPALLGWYGLLLSAVQCGLVVTHQGLIKQVQREWTSQTAASPFLSNLVRASAKPTVVLAAAMAVMLFVLHASGGVPLDFGLFGWLILANLGVVAAVILQTALLAEERYWANLATNAVGSVTRSFGPPLLVVLLGASLGIVSSAFLIHLTLTVASAAWLLRPAWRRTQATPIDSKGDLGTTLQAFAVIGLFGWLASAAPRWLAAVVLDAEHIGYFVLAGNLALVVPAAIGGVLINYSFPRVFAGARDGGSARETLRNTHRIVAFLMVGTQLGLLALAAVAPHLIGLVIAERYTPAIDWLLPAGGAALAATTAQFYHNALLARGHNRQCVWLSVWSGLLRLAAMAVACAVDVHAFRVVLIALPWATVALEAWYAERQLRQVREAA